MTRKTFIRLRESFPGVGEKPEKFTKDCVVKRDTLFVGVSENEKLQDLHREKEADNETDPIH